MGEANLHENFPEMARARAPFVGSDREKLITLELQI